MFRETEHLNIRSIVIALSLLGFLSGCSTMPVNDGTLTQENRKTYIPQEHGEILATDTAFNPKTGEIRYTLPESAYVRVRVGINQGGALLRHVMDWELREKGPHMETWDKKDTSGLIDFGDRPDYMLVLNCRPAKNQESPRKSPSVNVTFPEAKEKTEQNDPLVNGVVPLRVAVEGKDSQWLSETKFEVAIYVDYVFLMEDEVGTNPYNYLLDTSQFQEGRHTLTINVIAYNGDMGTKSISFYVQRPTNG